MISNQENLTEMTKPPVQSMSCMDKSIIFQYDFLCLQRQNQTSVMSGAKPRRGQGADSGYYAKVFSFWIKTNFQQLGC